MHLSTRSSYSNRSTSTGRPLGLLLLHICRNVYLLLSPWTTPSPSTESAPDCRASIVDASEWVGTHASQLIAGAAAGATMVSPGIVPFVVARRPADNATREQAAARVQPQGQAAAVEAQPVSQPWSIDYLNTALTAAMEATRGAVAPVAGGRFIPVQWRRN